MKSWWERVLGCVLGRLVVPQGCRFGRKFGRVRSKAVRRLGVGRSLVLVPPVLLQIALPGYRFESDCSGCRKNRVDVPLRFRRPRSPSPNVAVVLRLHRGCDTPR